MVYSAVLRFDLRRPLLPFGALVALGFVAAAAFGALADPLFYYLGPIVIVVGAGLNVLLLMDIDPELARADDWAALRNWAGSIWPQPPDYSHRGSVIE